MKISIDFKKFGSIYTEIFKWLILFNLVILILGIYPMEIIKEVIQ